MKLYNINTIGTNDVSNNQPLPEAGKTSELACCTNWGKEYLRGTGDGWEEISPDVYHDLLAIGH